MRTPRAASAANPTRPRPSAAKLPAERSDQVQSLVRALTIVNRLAATDEGATLTEVAQQVGLSPSTPSGGCGRSACRPSSPAAPS